MTISKRRRHVGFKSDVKKGSKSMFVAVKFSRRKRPYWMNPLSLFRCIMSCDHEEMQKRVNVLETTLCQISERIKRKEGRKPEPCSKESKRKEDDNGGGDDRFVLRIEAEQKIKEIDNEEEKKVKVDNREEELKKTDKEMCKNRKAKKSRERKPHDGDKVTDEKDNLCSHITGDVCVQTDWNHTLNVEDVSIPGEQMKTQKIFESVVEKTVKKSIVSTLDKYVKDDIEKYIKKCVESSMRQYCNNTQMNNVSDDTSISASMYDSFSNLNFIPVEKGKQIIDKTYPLTELSDTSSILKKKFKVRSPSSLKKYRLRSWSKRKGLHVKEMNKKDNVYESMCNGDSESKQYIRQLLKKSEHLRRKFSLAQIRKYGKMKL